jgi:hypothetical protein
MQRRLMVLFLTLGLIKGVLSHNGNSNTALAVCQAPDFEDCPVTDSLVSLASRQWRQ